MVPAAVGFIILGHQIATLVFQHGAFHGGQTSEVATALVGYAPQLPFIGIDQLLIFAFYARHDTVTPMLAGIFGVAVYVSFAFLLFGHQVLGLALANTIQIGLHATLLAVLLLRSIGWFDAGRLGQTVGKVALASAVMAAAVLGVNAVMSHAALGQYTHLWVVLVPMLVAIVLYGVALNLLGVEDVGLIREMVTRRIRGADPSTGSPESGA
jgi:putative peptidoglycan lipid II flippase